MSRLLVAVLIPLALAACVARTPAPVPVPVQQQLTIGGVDIPATNIVSAEPGFDEIGMPVVDIRLSKAGAVMFELLTRANVGKDLPIRFGATLLSSPRVVEPIPDGLIRISGAMTAEDATRLAARIKEK